MQRALSPDVPPFDRADAGFASSLASQGRRRSHSWRRGRGAAPELRRWLVRRWCRGCRRHGRVCAMHHVISSMVLRLRAAGCAAGCRAPARCRSACRTVPCGCLTWGLASAAPPIRTWSGAVPPHPLVIHLLHGRQHLGNVAGQCEARSFRRRQAANWPPAARRCCRRWQRSDDAKRPPAHTTKTPGLLSTLLAFYTTRVLARQRTVLLISPDIRV